MNTYAIDPRTLTFSPWNANSVNPENQKRLQESIRRNGIFRPVVVRQLEDGTLQVIAGEHTTKAVIALGHETIDVYDLGPIDDKKAKEISIIDNQHYGHEDTLKLADILATLEGNPEEYLPWTDNELKAIFKSNEIDLDSLDFSGLDLPEDSKPKASDETLAAATVSHQFMKFKVPIADAEYVQRCIEAIIKRQGITGSDSLANAGDALVWLCTNTKE